MRRPKRKSQASQTRHLTDAKGWLDESDPFFKTMARIVDARRIPRLLSE
jgi:hypothetical protein